MTIASTLGIIDAAGSILKKVDIGKAIDRSAEIYSRSTTAGRAITSLSNQTTILSRSFIDESIIDEPILPNVNRCLHEWYTAQVIAALHLSQVVAGQRTVQDVMTVVQTGQNVRENAIGGRASNYVWDTVRGRTVGQESFLENYLGIPAETDAFGMEDLYGPLSHDQMREANRQRREAQIKADAKADAGGTSSSDTTNDDKPVMDNQIQVRSVASSDHRIGPMGELYELKLTNPNGGESTTVPVFIQMQPSIVPADVVPRFIDMNVSPTIWQRWTQMRVGEIHWFKDFLLNRDLIRRQKSVIKDKATADAFTDYLRTVSKKDQYAIGDATDRLGSRQSSNLANSVMIFSEESVNQAKLDSGIDLHKPEDRRRYFRDTYTMIIVVIDPLHQRVTVYFNGIDGEINAPYNEFRPKDTKFDPKDFMVALQAFSTNNISRLR